MKLAANFSFFSPPKLEINWRHISYHNTEEVGEFLRKKDALLQLIWTTKTDFMQIRMKNKVELKHLVIYGHRSYSTVNAGSAKTEELGGNWRLKMWF